MINSGFKDKSRLLCPTLSSSMFKSPHTQKGLLKDVLRQVSWATTSLQWAITIWLTAREGKHDKGKVGALTPWEYTWLPVSTDPLRQNSPSAHSCVLLSLCRTPHQLDLSPQPSHELPRWLENRACLPKPSCPSMCELPLMSVGILCTLAFTQVVSSGFFSYLLAVLWSYTRVLMLLPPPKKGW